MSLSLSLHWVFTVLCAVLGLSTHAADPPRKSNNLTDVVQWDNYTLFLHDQRMFLYSGEFHTFRLPVVDLWLDIFQKMVAAGLNGVSIYIHWGLTNPAPGVLDFNDWRALQPIYDAAKLAGIFIVLRPGPYINAETTAGGLALWSTSLVEGEVRQNTTSWNAAYQPYVSAIIDSVKPNQVTEGGPGTTLTHIIDNEYSQTPELNAEYFADLEKQYRENGVVVPLTYNDPGEKAGFINGTGAPDLYGLDDYPNEFNCTNGSSWNPIHTNYHQYHITNEPDRPFCMPKFQGGSHDSWGGPGYDACRARVGPDFEDVFYKNNWAANVKMHSVYMFYGGTSWGAINYPGAYTSYDYGAAIKETRLLWEKYDEMKRQAFFIRSSPQFRKTDWIGDNNATGTGIPGVTVNGTGTFATFLRNSDSGTGFLIARQLNSSSLARTNFRVSVDTLHGRISLPQTFDAIELNGRQSKVIITDYSFGANGSVLSTTATVFFAGTIGSRDVLFLTGDADQSHEASLMLSGTGSRSDYSHVKYTTSHALRDATTITVRSGFKPELITLWDSDEQLVVFSDPVTAATFWSPAIREETEHTIPGLETFWQFGTNTTVLVGGPYLVRNVTINGSTLSLYGDLNATVPLTVIGLPSITHVTWNGQAVSVKNEGRGVLTGELTLSSKVREVKVPKLTVWKYAESLPEIQAGFNDSNWIVADHTTTNITVQMAYGDGRVLYGCDYGFCENNILWRGHFNATGEETAANLSINGGTGHAASVWINDVFIDTISSLTAVGDANATFSFPEASVIPGQDNVITVLQDHMGNNEGTDQKSERGIRGFELYSGVGSFSTWKVQGKLGGYTGFPDRVRGVLNEGGLYGERQGWHLPGFDISNWTTRALSEGLPESKAGVGFFVTTFELRVSRGVDAMMSFQFSEENAPYRALLFVNGWKFGKRVANIGPQTRFPVPPGILDYNGSNTVAVALWVMQDEEVHPALELVVDGAVEGGVGPISTNNPAWSPR
ncbi:glycoside hydrolase family 35 protein [Polyporus arcularius HHB13444]|uniref:beta-galactosidase n=1 Tax=Polyporus arcularius HHB13444 TaxID=1314778 RepID=A0A5C3PM25_9APHY|nr:glycoside hydrolase family 35 protein [Polyporus arcularius HHB13444]